MRLIKTHKRESLNQYIGRLVKLYTRNGYQNIEYEVKMVDGEHIVDVYGHKDIKLNPLRKDLMETIKRTKRSPRAVSIDLNMPYGTFYHYVRGKVKKNETYHELIRRIETRYNLTNKKNNETMTELIGGIQNASN